jgi:tetratricopeptide (TPR) repeat protein
MVSADGLPQQVLFDSFKHRVSHATNYLILAHGYKHGYAAAEKRFDDAVAHLDQAVRLEEALVYTEPSEWAFPPRHALGAVLLAAGRASEAENVFWQDLKRHRENGWALTGLAKALRAQDKRELAAVVEKRLAAAWARADVKPDAARFGHAVAAAARP